MADVAAVDQVAQGGIQTDDHTAVVATFQFDTTAIILTPDNSKGDATAEGHKFPTVSWKSKSFSKWTFKGPLMYYEALYILATMCTVTVVDNLDGTFTWTCDFRPKKKNAIKLLTLEQGAEDGSYAARAIGCRGDSFNLDTSHDTMDFNGGGFGEFYQAGVTLSTKNTKRGIHVYNNIPTSGYIQVSIADVTMDDGTVIVGAGSGHIPYNTTAAGVATLLQSGLADANPDLAISIIGTGGALNSDPQVDVVLEFAGAYAGLLVPALTFDMQMSPGLISGVLVQSGGNMPEAEETVVEPPQCDIYLASDPADLEDGAFQLSRNYETKTSVGNLAGPNWPQDSRNRSYGSALELKGLTATQSVKMMLDATGVATLNSLLAGDRFFLRVANTGPEIGETGVNHSFTMDVCFDPATPNGPMEEQGAWVMEMSGKVMEDRAWGHALVFTFVNGRAAL